MENKLFEPRVDKLRHIVTIEIYENCTSLIVKTPKSVEKMTYHELVGILETRKQDLIWEQREYNIKKKLIPKSKSTKNKKIKINK